MGGRPNAGRPEPKAPRAGLIAIEVDDIQRVPRTAVHVLLGRDGAGHRVVAVPSASMLARVRPVIERGRKAIVYVPRFAVLVTTEAEETAMVAFVAPGEPWS